MSLRWFHAAIAALFLLFQTAPADAAPGSALDFDGSDDYVSFASAPQASLDAITVSWWVKVPAGAAAWNDWWTIQVPGGAELVAEMDSGGTVQMYIVNGWISGGVQFGDTGGNNLRDGQWHHLVFTASTGAATLYLDGTAISPTVNWQAGDSVNGFAISARLSDTVNRQIRSAVDEMAIYNRHFSAAEVAGLYNSGQGVYGQSSDTGLVAGWHFDENSGTTVADYSGNGVTGALQNGPAWITGIVDEPGGDTTAPSISNVSVGNVTETSFDVTWDTDENATSQVEYGTTTAYGSATTLATNLVASHSMTVSGLTANTQYHFRVLSKDAADNLAEGSDQTVTTLAGGDTTPPVISNVSVTDKTQNSVKISWTTDEGATSQVKYGVDSNYTEQSPLYTTLTQAHEVTLTGLNAGSTYHFNVYSKDVADNEGSATDMTFTTESTAGGAGFALSFDGNDDYVTFSQVPNVPLDAITVSWWVKVPNQAPAWKDWWTIQIAGGGELVAEINHEKTLQMYVVNGGIPGAPQFGDITQTALDDNEWHHLVFTAGSGTAAVYVDGQLAGSVSNWQATDAITGLALSARLSDTTTRQIQSDIDEFVIYSREMTLSEVQALYNNGNGVYGDSSDTDLVAGWHFDENIGSTAADFSVNNITATLQNGVAWVPGNVASGSGGGDTTPPTVSTVTVSDVGESVATLTWTTNEPADTQAEYGEDSNYGSLSQLEPGSREVHVVNLSGLQPGTEYHVRGLSRDAAGNLGVGPDRTFTTEAATGQDTTPPVISNVVLSNVTDTGVTVSWQTDEPADSQLIYGIDSTYGAQSSWVNSQSLTHSITITGLNEGTTYYLRAVSKDSAGNESQSAEESFVAESPVVGGGPGSALDLDGVDDWVEFTTPPAGNVNEFTISWWVNVPSAGFQSWKVWWWMELSDGSEIVSTLRDTGTPAFYFASGWPVGANQIEDISDDLRDTGWRHLAVVMSQTEGLKFYIDGILKGTAQSWGVNASIADFSIARSTSFIRSGVDEMRLYSKGLTEQEVESLYNHGDGYYGDPGNLGAHLIAGWHFDENTGTTIADDSGNGYDGTLHGSPNWIGGDIEIPGSGGDEGPAIYNVKVKDVTTSEAKVTWTTNEDADSMVMYGLDSNVDDWDNSNSALTTDHNLPMTGLPENQEIFYCIRSTNAAGVPLDAEISSFYTLQSGTVPVISSVDDSHVADRFAIISWQTDIPADHKVFYGTSPNPQTNFSTQSMHDEDPTQHTILIENLEEEQTYYYRIESVNQADVGANPPATPATHSGQFTTADEDVNPPIDYDMDVTPYAHTFSMRWKTNEPAQSFVEGVGVYPFTNQYTVSDVNTVDHRLNEPASEGTIPDPFTISPLIPDTLYVFTARSRDGDDESRTLAQSFRTLAENTTPPVIRSVHVEQITQTSAVVKWSTNQRATSQVEMSTGEMYPQTASAEYVINHAIELDNLNPGQTYSFKVRSQNDNPDVTQPAEVGGFSFTTDAVGTRGNGAALDFDAYQNVVSVDGFNETLDQFSVSWWVNVPSKGFQGLRDWWVASGSSGSVYARISALGNPMIGYSDVPDEDLRETGWRHLVVVYDATPGIESHKLYLDGQLLGTAAWATSIHLDKFEIGNNTADSYPRAIRSAIDEMRLYRKALSQAEISALYNNGYGMYGDPPTAAPDLIAGWHFDEGSGNVLKANASQFNGTIQGTAAWVSGHINVQPDELPIWANLAVVDEGVETPYGDHLFAVWTTFKQGDVLADSYEFCIVADVQDSSACVWADVGNQTSVNASKTLTEGQTYFMFVRAKIGGKIVSHEAVSDGITYNSSASGGTVIDDFGGRNISGSGLQEVWSLENSPYIIHTRVAVTNGAMLIIEPGVMVRFKQGAALEVDGFSSPDGILVAAGQPHAPVVFTSAEASPQSASWEGVLFSYTGVDSRMDYTIIEYAGESEASLTTSTAKPSWTNSILRYSAGQALRIEQGKLPFLENNLIHGNQEDAIRFYANAAQFEANITIQDHGVPYIFSGSVSSDIAGAGADVLTIEKGVRIQFDAGAELRLHDTNLLAQGTAQDPIVFTSNAANPAPGDWNGIHLLGDGDWVFDHVEVEYAGGSSLNNSAAIMAYTGAISTESYLEIKHSSIKDSATYGIYTDGGSPVVQIENSNFEGNQSGGIKAESGSVMARANWWGDSLGPRLDGVGPGNGQIVSGVVDFMPWLGQTAGGAFEWQSPDVGPAVFNPFESVTGQALFHAVLSETGTWTLAIKDGQTILREETQNVAGGQSIDWLWDGTDNTEQNYVDGNNKTYTFEWTATKSGNSAIQPPPLVGQITVDANAPVARIANIKPYDGLLGSVSIQGTATGNPFQNYQLQYQIAGKSWQNVTSLVSGDVIDGQLATWDVSAIQNAGQQYQGPLRLRLTVNADGQSAEHELPVTVNQAVFGVSAEPEVVNINQMPDGPVRINYRLVQDAEVTISVYEYNSDGPNPLVRTLLSDFFRPKGTHFTVWNLRDGSNTPVPPGAYYYVVEADVGLASPYVVGAADGSNLGTADDGVFGVWWSDHNFDVYQSEVGRDRFHTSRPQRVHAIVEELGGGQIDEILDLGVPAGEHSIMWDGYTDSGQVFTGSYSIKVTPYPLPRPWIIVTADEQIIDPVTVRPYLIHPRLNEQSTISYQLTKDAEVTVNIYPNGGSVPVLSFDQGLQGGGQLHSLMWDGRDDEGRLLSDEGLFRIEINALDTQTGQLTTRSGALTIK